MAVSMNAPSVTSNTKRGVIGGFISAHGEFNTNLRDASVNAMQRQSNAI